MKLYSTNNKTQLVSFKEALFKGLPDDNGLYMPTHIPTLSNDFLNHLQEFSLPEIAFEVAATLMGTDEISADDLRKIINTAINFPAPVVSLTDDTHILELFHGPSLAFKDFGARFMAQCMSHYLRHDDRQLTILVATSGDTGGAVAAGFFNTPNIKVIILYPSGKVSDLQEKQLTTLGNNIAACEIEGTFDDCQALVKAAFLDNDLRTAYHLSSANSINIARLIPQSFYYFEAFKQVKTAKKVNFIVPSGNFGNLTAGLFAQKMGLPVHQFIAATNTNDVVPTYLQTGSYTPRPSAATLSNAMDVGNPSNFARMLDLYCSTWNNMAAAIQGFGVSDAETIATMQAVYEKHNYMLDPHGAVGYKAWETYKTNQPDEVGIILETAHPAKFIDIVEAALEQKIAIPNPLAALADKKKVATLLPKDFHTFKQHLLTTL